MSLSDPELLTDVTLFQGLTVKQWERLKNLLHYQNFPAGTHIITAEQPGEMVYIIRGGTVKIFQEQADGTTVILAILGPGDVVGEMSMVDSVGRSANVVALEETTLIWLDRIAFQYCLDTMPKINYNLVRILSQRIRLANEQIQALASLDVNGRMARQFLAFAERYGVVREMGDILIPLRLTQSDLAHLVGASRKRVNQVMVHFKRSGLIEVDTDGRICVRDQAALAQMCH